MDVVSQSNSTYGIPLLDAGSVESESAGIVENEKEMLHSAQGLNLLIEREMKLSNIKRDRIILVGLHQGIPPYLLFAWPSLNGLPRWCNGSATRLDSSIALCRCSCCGWLFALATQNPAGTHSFRLRISIILNLFLSA